MNPDSSPKPASRRILIVDDDEEMSYPVGMMLKLLGNFEIDYALNARTAYIKLTKNDYALLITDYQMPEVNGLDLIEIVRRMGMKIPIVILTSETGSAFAQQVAELGAELAYKPINLEELGEVVKKYL